VGSLLVLLLPSKPEECLRLVDPALLELEEGGGIVNELVVGAPEDASNQILVLSGQREAEYRW
jgi:hypothetical protein